MSQKKLMIGLPVALILGSSAIAIGVVPGVRNWIDQTVPWLGINGPKSTTLAGVPNEQTIREADRNLPPGPVGSMASVLSGLENAKPHFEVQFAQATLPLPPARQVQGFGEDSALNQTTRLAQSPAINTIPATGLNVPSSANGTIVVKEASVFFPDDSTVAAQADGIIMKLFVDDGAMIQAGMPMIEIDPRLAESEVEVSKRELSAAELKASDDSNVKYSKAAKKVAEKEVEMSKELASRGAEGTMDGEKKRLELEKAGFQVGVSEIEKLRDAADVGVKTAKLTASKVQVELRKMPAQRTGMVSEIAKRQFDWVRAGEPILRLTSMEKIRIKGVAEVFDSPQFLLNAPANVTIYYAAGKSLPEPVRGIVTYVSPRSFGQNRYQIYVDLPNQVTADGQYLFREGMVATVEVTPRSR